MLVAAASWRPGGPSPSVAEVLAQPVLAHYVTGWPRPGDMGVVAVHDGRRIGAAWLRLLPATDPGYGFVDAATPELAIGVVPGRRGQGVGRRLLEGLLAAARERGYPAVSLSVEPDNPARRLYERAGFRQVGEAGGSLTLLVRLRAPD